MRPTAFQITAWFFAALLGSIAFLGEGLHYLPGCGHGVLLPGGIIVLGLNDRAGSSSIDDSTTAFAASRVPSQRVLSTDDCAICSLLAAGKQAARPISFTATSAVVTSVTAHHALPLPRLPAPSFAARAPPA